MEHDEIQTLVWWAKERVRGFMSGMHRSPDFGYSVEFAQHRGYVPGDSPRYIDWSVLAKTDKYLTKQFEAETNVRTYFLVDSSSSMFYPDGPQSKWTEAIRLLALLSTLLLKQRDAMGLLEISANEETFFEAKTTGGWVEQMLYHIQGRPDQQRFNADLKLGLEHLLERIPRRSQVVILSDVFQTNEESILDASARLQHENHQVIHLVYYSKTAELDALHLVGNTSWDLETGKKSLLTEDDRKNFSAFVQEKLQRWEEGARSRGIDCHLLNSDEGALVHVRQILA